jgi:hypothetical protein
MPVKLPAPKHTTEDLGDKLVMSIPYSTRWFSALSQLLWLVFQAGLVILMVFVLIAIGKEADPISRFFFYLILAGTLFMTAGIAFAFYGFLWHVLGREIVQVSSQSIMINRTMLGQGSPKEYSADSVKDLRLLPAVAALFRTGLAWSYAFRFPMLSRWTGLLAFDYGAKTFRFAAGIDEAEAKQILAGIQQKFPQYRS